MRALALVAVLAACGGDDGGGGGGGGDAAHQACVTESNMYRSMNGKPDLVWSAALEAYADEGAKHDFSTSPHDHFSSTSGGGIAFAENECPQQGNWQLPAGGDMAALVADCIAAFYSEGPGGGHYDNLMGNYSTIGCGIYQSGTKVTIVQDLGN
jgi:hypothetical protein